SSLQTSAVWDSFHDSRLYKGELALNAKGIEQVRRRAKCIAYSNQFGEAFKLLRSHGEFGGEASYNRIRDEAGSLYIRNYAIGRHAVTNAFQNDHLSIKVDK